MSTQRKNDASGEQSSGKGDSFLDPHCGQTPTRCDKSTLSVVSGASSAFAAACGNSSELRIVTPASVIGLVCEIKLYPEECMNGRDNRSVKQLRTSRVGSEPRRGNCRRGRTCRRSEPRSGSAGPPAPATLVESFDIEPFSDFSSK